MCSNSGHAFIFRSFRAALGGKVAFILVRSLPLCLTVAQVLLCVPLAGVRTIQPMDIKFIQSASLSSTRSSSTYNTLGDRRYFLASFHFLLPLLPPHTVLALVSIQGHHLIFILLSHQQLLTPFHL